MKILVVGDWHSELHEEAVFNAFIHLGHDVQKFAWYEYFKPSNKLDGFLKRLQNRFIWGPLLYKLNKDLFDVVEKFSPDVIFVYRGTHINVNTLSKIKRCLSNVILVGYNNDDPFGAGHPYSLWRHFINAIPQYDLMLAYRFHNIVEFKDAGAKRVEMLRSWYFPERNHPLQLSNQDMHKYECDVVFVGHYEDDGREEYLEELVRQGFNFKLYGPGWNGNLKNDSLLKKLSPIMMLNGSEYNKAINGAKIALCFLSKLNRDTYTRRCFEIPATKTLLISEYSDDLSKLYKEGIEADYFRTKEELVAKVGMYINNKELRESVAFNGYLRVKRDGHNVISRMEQVLMWIESAKLSMQSPDKIDA